VFGVCEAGVPRSGSLHWSPPDIEKTPRLSSVERTECGKACGNRDAVVWSGLLETITTVMGSSRSLCP
jgi:hypothetical protein